MRKQNYEKVATCTPQGTLKPISPVILDQVLQNSYQRYYREEDAHKVAAICREAGVACMRAGRWKEASDWFQRGLKTCLNADGMENTEDYKEDAFDLAERIDFLWLQLFPQEPSPGNICRVQDYYFGIFLDRIM